MITRLNLFLAALLLLSCVWLVRSSNESRGLFYQLEKAREAERELQIEFDRLKVERRTAATPLVVEDMVRTRLKMYNATSVDILYLNGAPVRGQAAPRRQAEAPASAAPQGTAEAAP